MAHAIGNKSSSPGLSIAHEVSKFQPVDSYVHDNQKFQNAEGHNEIKYMYVK